mgnify:FL=1|jgi:hypothetical protein
MQIRNISRAAVLMAGLFGLVFQASAELDLSIREGVMPANRKMQCSTVDNEEKTYVWHGTAYSRRMGGGTNSCLVCWV